MFNSAFLSAPVETQSQLQDRLETAGEHFARRGLRWAFWICEDWIAPGIRRRLSRTCEAFNLRLSSEMPGMAADHIVAPQRRLPEIDILRVASGEELDDFRAIGSTCFHVPIAWFGGVPPLSLPPTRAQQRQFAYHVELPPGTVNARDFHDYCLRWFPTVERAATEQHVPASTKDGGRGCDDHLAESAQFGFSDDAFSNQQLGRLGLRSGRYWLRFAAAFEDRQPNVWPNEPAFQN